MGRQRNGSLFAPGKCGPYPRVAAHWVRSNRPTTCQGLSNLRIKEMSELLEEIQEEFLTADARCSEVWFVLFSKQVAAPGRQKSKLSALAKTPASRGYTGFRHNEVAAGARAVGKNICPAARGGR